MNEFGKQCVRLRRQDHSLLEIVRITGKGKSSVYPYIKNIPLSEKRMAATYNANKLHLHRIAAARKGKSLRNFKKFESWGKETTLLVSHLLFDGEISRASCIYNNRSTALIERVRNSMGAIYEFKPKEYTNLKTGVARISYHNVALANYLKNKSEDLLIKAPNLQRELKREFLRAFFDDEGCMDFRPNTNARRVRGYQKDINILKLVSSLLSDFGIKSNFQKPNEVVISGKENLLKFQKEINFSPGVFINGNRTNSIWKKHLEKRDLLGRAISSFKV